MKKKIINGLIAFLGLTILLFILFFIFYQYFFFSSLKKPLSVFDDIPKDSSLEKSIDINLNELTKNYQEKEFTTQDGRLKIENLSEWFLTKDEQILKKAVLKNFPEQYDLRLVFFAQKIKNNKIANLTLSEGFFGDKESAGEVFEVIKKAIEKNGIEMETIDYEIENNEIMFKALYKKADQENFLSKEKIILANQENKKFFIITFYAPEKNWETFKDEAEMILNSVNLVN